MKAETGSPVRRRKLGVTRPLVARLCVRCAVASDSDEAYEPLSAYSLSLAALT